jgi:hypothetical protein
MEDELANADNSGVLSKINSAGLVNITMNNLWQNFFDHYRSGKYLSASNDLDCIWTILGGEKDMAGSDGEKNYLAMEEELSKIGLLQNNVEVKGFGKVNDEQIHKFMKHKAILLKKSLLLRRLQNTQGKGSAYYDSDESDFD